MVLIAVKGKGAGEAYNVAAGTSISINEIVNQICGAMNVKPAIKYTGKSRPGEPNKWVVDITCIKELGFSPKVLLKEGIIKTVSWFKTENIAGNG
jgi:nucleoside-diphosphate-sugar epimerase